MDTVGIKRKNTPSKAFPLGRSDDLFTKLTMHCTHSALCPAATGKQAGQPRYGHLIGNRWIDRNGGAAEVGRLVQASAATHHVPVVLELGGKSPQVVFADADLATAATQVCKAITQNAGQTRSAGSRVLIQRSVSGQVVINCDGAGGGVELSFGGTKTAVNCYL